MKKISIMFIILLLSFTCFADPSEDEEIIPNEIFIESAKLGIMEDIIKYHDLGADINALDMFGWSALMWACQEGHTDIAKYLIDNGADVDYREENSGWTALIAASFKGHTEAVILLIEARVNVNPDISGFKNISSPIQYARRFGHTDIISLLENAGTE